MGIEQWFDAHLWVAYLMLLSAIVVPCVIAEWQIRRKKKKYGEYWFLY